MNGISKIKLKIKETIQNRCVNEFLGRLWQACRHWASVANGADVRPRPPARDEGVARHAHHLPSYRRKNKYEARNVANPISSTSSRCQLVARGRHADSANAALRMRLLEILSRMAVGLPSPPPILADQGITPTGPIRVGGQGVMPGPTGTPCRSDHPSPCEHDVQLAGAGEHAGASEAMLPNTTRSWIYTSAVRDAIAWAAIASPGEATWRPADISPSTCEIEPLCSIQHHGPDGS